jgi:hypothetical protein
MKKILLSLSVLCLPVMAVQAELPLFNQLDADQNGYVSKEEAQANLDLVALFEKLDTNADDKLTLEEYAAIMTKES